MARYLNDFRDILVATNDVRIAATLTHAENLTVTVIGGSLRKNYFTLTGYFAEMIMKDLCFDIAFLGIDAISLKGGLMITNMEEVQIKRKIIQASNKVVVLCDHSKFEIESFLNICGFNDVHMIITGKEVDEKIYKNYVDAGINLVLV
jgi:DeoR/GlpR family transcriptional regulator of sugar metabolism